MAEERGGRKNVAVGDTYHTLLKVLAAVRGQGDTVTGLANEFIHEGCRRSFEEDPRAADLVRELIARDSTLDEDQQKGEDLKKRALALLEQLAAQTEPAAG